MTDTTDTTVSETADDTTTVENTEVEPAEDKDERNLRESSTGEPGGNLPQGEPDDTEPAEDADTFPREYVERLRRESQNYRERATKGDTYAQRLHTELVRATGKLADPTDLPFDADHLDDPDGLAAAVDDLLARKPHLATRKPAGDIGQGPVAGNGSGVDLAAILRQRAQ